jgi:hypothetical protein
MEYLSLIIVVLFAATGYILAIKKSDHSNHHKEPSPFEIHI